jgi:hypothetical protein
MQWSSTWGTSTSGITLKLHKGYAKISYGVCKIEYIYIYIYIYINTLIKTTVRNKYLFVLDFIVHYYNMFRPRSVAIFR